MNKQILSNRWFVWVIAIIIIAGFGIWGFIQYSVIEMDNPDIKFQFPLLQSTQEEFTSKEILDAVYSDYKVPDRFFEDALERGGKISDSVYYERVLENNKWMFYCTNYFNTAKQFVEKNVAEYNKQEPKEFYPDRVIIETNENEKFFEFKTIEEQTTSPDRKYYLRYRVYKCSYISDLQHGMYYKKDDGISDNYIGIFTQKPITIKNVKELVEFLWYSAFSNYNISGSKVLSSFVEEDNKSIKHMIFETRTVGGDWNMCDQITLVKSTYTVNIDSGKIELIQEDIRTIEGNCH